MSRKDEKRGGLFARFRSAPAGGRVSTDPMRNCALSAAFGEAKAPKDFDWVRQSVPCQWACPARTDIPGYLAAIAAGDFAEAYRLNLRDNVFPAVLGRVCTRPCEPVCRHGGEGLGEPVAICFSKRSAADFLGSDVPVVLPPLFPPSGKRVAVVGAGAAGLAAARELARFGHAVTVLERHAEPGGMMVQGIPAFRLPRDLVAREIEQIRRAGVEIRCGVAVDGPAALADLLARHDAVVVATGTPKPARPTFPGAGLPGVRHGLEFLRAVHAGNAPAVGARVVVIGGGFTAVDCARVAKRLGAVAVTMVYRRTEEEMYITPGEVAAMREEGVAFLTRWSPSAVEAEGGRAAAVRFVATEPGPKGPDGRRTFVEVSGEEERVPADTVLLATGQSADAPWLPAAPPPSLFVTGDLAHGARSLIDATADGKACARAVDRLLAGAERLADAVAIEEVRATGRTRELDAIPRQPMPQLEPAARGPAAEVDTGFAAAAARTEASRCYLCHLKFEIDNDLCIYCDRCLKVKPVEGCIVKARALKHDAEGRIAGYHPSTHVRDYNLLWIDPAQCIRCNACREVCPVECITLQKVSLGVVANA